jgi:hypothetical protein
LVGNSGGKRYLGRLGVDEGNNIGEEIGERVWNGFIWPRIQ